MSKRSQNKSTIFPLPSSPHCAPRMMILLMTLTRLLYRAGRSCRAVLRCDHAALRGLPEARRGRIRSTGARYFHRQVENLPAFRSAEDPRAYGETEYRAFAQGHPPAVDANQRRRRGIRQGLRPGRADFALGPDCRGIGLSEHSQPERIFRERPGCQPIFDGRLGAAHVREVPRRVSPGGAAVLCEPSRLGTEERRTTVRAGRVVTASKPYHSRLRSPLEVIVRIKTFFEDGAPGL